MEHVSIELQILSGMDVGYGKTRSTLQQGVYNVVFRYLDEEAGIYAGKAALNLINGLLAEKTFDIGEVVDDLVRIRESNLLVPSTQAIVDEASVRGIPTLRLDEYNLIQLGTGKYRKLARATITSDTAFIAVESADDKYLSTRMLQDYGVPVPPTLLTADPLTALEFFRKNSPAVVKPKQGALGADLWMHLYTENEFLGAFEKVAEKHGEVLMQPEIKGNCYRLLVINYQFVAATELIPPLVTGNGIDDIEKLIESLNADPARQPGDKGILSYVKPDELTLRILQQYGFTLQTVLPDGFQLPLKYSGNPKIGGRSVDVTDMVHPLNRYMAERAALALGLNIAGVDVIAVNLTEPINETGGVILEINAAPDFRMHMKPASGKARNVAAFLICSFHPDYQIMYRSSPSRERLARQLPPQCSGTACSGRDCYAALLVPKACSPEM